MIFMLWHGGTNYAHGYVADDVEVYTDIESALSEARNRMTMGHRWPGTFPYANKPHEQSLTPCVDEASYLDVWLEDPTPEPCEPDARYVWSETAEEYVREDG